MTLHWCPVRLVSCLTPFHFNSFRCFRGTRPSYRAVLEGVRSRLGVACSDRLATADLESEIFLHLLNHYADGMEDERR